MLSCFLTFRTNDEVIVSSHKNDFYQEVKSAETKEENVSFSKTFCFDEYSLLAKAGVSHEKFTCGETLLKRLNFFIYC